MHDNFIWIPFTSFNQPATGVENRNDNCPEYPNAGQADSDRDGVGDACDNCPESPNPHQADTDSDTLGERCDTNLVSRSTFV